MNKAIKRFTAGALLTVSVLALAGCGSADKVGYVDVYKLRMQSAKAMELQQKVEAKDKEISARLDQVKATKSEDEYKQENAKASQEFDIYRKAMSSEFKSYVESNNAQVAKEQKYTIVIDGMTVTEGGTDLTETVLEKMGKAKTDAGTSATGSSTSGAGGAATEKK